MKEKDQLKKEDFQLKEKDQLKKEKVNERSSEAETELERFMSKGTVVASEAMR